MKFHLVSRRRWGYLESRRTTYGTLIVPKKKKKKEKGKKKIKMSICQLIYITATLFELDVTAKKHREVETTLENIAVSFGVFLSKFKI